MNCHDLLGKQEKKTPGQIPPGNQMGLKRQRPGPLPSQPPKQNPQAKRPRVGVMAGQMMSPPKFGGPQPLPQNVPPPRETEDGSQGLCRM